MTEGVRGNLFFDAGAFGGFADRLLRYSFVEVVAVDGACERVGGAL